LRGWMKPSRIGLSRLESGLHAGERLVTPLGELAGGDAKLSAERVERLAAEEAQYDLGLAAAGPAAAVGGMVLAVALVGSARAPRSLRRRRRLVSWRIKGVVHCALESQTGVPRNCAAHRSYHAPTLVRDRPVSASVRSLPCKPA
jgi:hypothetical protein